MGERAFVTGLQANLGLPQNSLEIPVQKTIEWYNKGGYVLHGPMCGRKDA